MKRTLLLQEIRIMRFEEAYTSWQRRSLTQEEAARLLGVSDRTFRRYLCRYEEQGLEGLFDRRLSQESVRKAPVDEVFRLVTLYRKRYFGFTVKHFYSWYRRAHGGSRSYTWVKNTLQAKGAVQKASRRGAHRKKRQRAPYPGMMLHQDGSKHPWVEDQVWDLIITLDDATGEHYSMFFVPEEGTWSSLRGVRDVLERKGLFASLYTDRGSHYWYTPREGGKVDKGRLTQFGRAMRQLGIEMIPAYSPQARGRCERAFKTHQDRLPKELTMNGITTMDQANRYLEDVYRPAFNEEFTVKPMEQEDLFVPWAGANLDDILCEEFVRTVRNDNCVVFKNLTLQIPKDPYRCHYVKAKVRLHRYADGFIALFHGPKKLALYNTKGELLEKKKTTAA
jgi:transposase